MLQDQVTKTETSYMNVICVRLTNNDSLLTSSVIGVPNFPEQRLRFVNRLKRRQGAFKI